MRYERGSGILDVVQISMKYDRNEASDNALESPSPAELVSIKFLGVRGHLGGGS